MNIVNCPPFDPDEVAARRAIRCRKVDERKVVEDIKSSYLLVNNVAAVPNCEILRKQGHRARVGRWALLARVCAAFEASTRSPIWNRDAAVRPAVEVGVASSLDDLSAMSRSMLSELSELVLGASKKAPVFFGKPLIRVITKGAQYSPIPVGLGNRIPLFLLRPVEVCRRIE